MGSENQIHIAVALLDFRHHFLLLHHAAAQGNHHVRMFLLIGPQLSQTAINPQIGIFPHRAGVVEHKIRFLRFYGLVADCLQNPQKLLRIPGIHLAPKGVDAAGKGTSQPGGKFGQLSPGPLHEVLLPLRLYGRRALVYGCFCIFYVVHGISGFFH